MQQLLMHQYLIGNKVILVKNQVILVKNQIYEEYMNRSERDG
jgi:hypothetical protein